MNADQLWLYLAWIATPLVIIALPFLMDLLDKVLLRHYGK